MAENMRLPQFLQNIDKLTREISKENLEAFIHEIARTWPESGRNAFKAKLKTFQENVKKDETASENQEAFLREIKEMIKKLEEINDGEICLDSEYNPEYDDWYNSMADEILFYDPEHLTDDIETAMELIHKCIDAERYGQGLELAELLSVLQISVDGDYGDYDGMPLSVDTLFDHNLLQGDYDDMVKECLYLEYMANKLKDRPEKMFTMIKNMEGCQVCLEDVLQEGNRELPEFDKFLGLWIKYLGEQDDTRAEKFLKEAQSMIQDEDVILENARKYADYHPALYLQLLQGKIDAREDSKMLDIGLEALDRITDADEIRAQIALLTAIYAKRTGKTDTKEACWTEAFFSVPSVVNYMRVRFAVRQWHLYRQNIQERIQKKIQENPFAKENSIFLFWEQDFEQMKKIGMEPKGALGWTGTFMKEGISLMLLLIYAGTSLPKALQDMLGRAVSACCFKTETYNWGTDEVSTENDKELFWELFSKWKKEVHMSDEEREQWLRRIEAWIGMRTQGIMMHNKRNYYDECAEFIAALVLVRESLGDAGARAGMLAHYRALYSRRYAFREELRRYGMYW